jgi:hypothetical protein
VHKEVDQMECFDQKDKSLTPIEFKQQTGLDAVKLRDMAFGDTPKQEVTDSRTQYKLAINKIKSYLSTRTTEPNLEIEKLLSWTKNGELCVDYISQIPTSTNKQVQMAAVTLDGGAIKYIKNPDREVQMAAVTQNGYAIHYIKNPDRELQMAAVSRNEYAIQYINNPDSEVIALANRKNKKNK